MPGVLANLTAMADHAAVSRWVAGYEAAWRAAGTGALPGLFTEDASYLRSPYAEPVTGLAAIRQMWDIERDSPDEVFTLATEIVAVDGPAAVVRAEVRYGDPVRQEYRDLWVIRLAADGRCTWFEEWPFWPERPYTARLPPELGDPVVVLGRIPDQPVRQGENPLRDAQRQREAAAPGAEVRLLQPDRVVRFQPHVDELRALQHLPPVALTRQRDGPLLGMRPAVVVLAEQ
jgi:ketosteroid isomerase-like protein